MIVKDLIKYDGSLIHKKFSYIYFKERVIPSGNIVAFRAPMDVTTNLIDLEDSLAHDFIWSDDAINFCWQIDILNNGFGAVAFQRLFNTQIAKILHEYIKIPIEVDGDDLICHAEHNQGGVTQLKGKASVSITHVFNGSTLGHTAINIKAGSKAPAFAYSTNLPEHSIENFMNAVIHEFYVLCDSLYVASAKVQI